MHSVFVFTFILNIQYTMRRTIKTADHKFVLNDHAKDSWIIKDILDSGISAEKISKILQMPLNTIRKMESEAVIIKSPNIVLE